MPDANGNFKGVSVPADAWERIFGDKSEPEPECDRLHCGDTIGPCPSCPSQQD